MMNLNSWKSYLVTHLVLDNLILFLNYFEEIFIFGNKAFNGIKIIQINRNFDKYWKIFFRFFECKTIKKIIENYLLIKLNIFNY